MTGAAGRSSHEKKPLGRASELRQASGTDGVIEVELEKTLIGLLPAGLS